MPHRQLVSLSFATLFAGLGIPISIGGSMLQWPIPMVVLSLVEVIAVAIIGYATARYSALVEGRTIQRDFLYNLTLLVLVLVVYLLASLLLVRVYLAPAIILVFVPLLAVFTHSLLLTAHRMVDWFFYRRETLPTAHQPAAPGPAGRRRCSPGREPGLCPGHAVRLGPCLLWANFDL